MDDHALDEDLLVLPETWRRALHARRGGAPGPEVTVDVGAPEAARRLVEETGGAVASLLKGKHGDQGLTEAARRHLDGEPDPAGAAVVAAVTVLGMPRRKDEVHRVFADAWVVEHGVAFAASALVELGRTVGDRVVGGDWIAPGVLSAHATGTWVGAVHRDKDNVVEVADELARRIRGLLAVADDGEYADAVERLAAQRSDWATRWLVSYLVPTREDWVDECCAGAFPAYWRPVRPMALCAVGKPEQLKAPIFADGLYWGEATRGLLATLVDGVGAGALEYLVQNADEAHIEAADRKRVLETIAVLPTDEAFQALVDRIGVKHARPALLEAMKRFPVRALRLLPVARSAQAAELLAEHVRAHAAAVPAILSELPEEARAVVEPLAASMVPVPDAEPEDVPSVLASPVWLDARRPVVIGLSVPAPAMAWLDGERQSWLDEGPGVKEPESGELEQLIEGHKAGGRGPAPLPLMLHGPVELIRPRLADYAGYPGTGGNRIMRYLVARFELDAGPVARRRAEAFPETCYPPLLPFLDEDAALLAADWLTKDRSRDAGRAYFGRHGLAAVPLLVPSALGKKAKQARNAGNALRHVAASQGIAPVVAAALAAHGEAAAKAVEELLVAHPLATGLVQPPKTGDWADPVGLPQVLLAGRERALPADAARNLIGLMAVSDRLAFQDLRTVCDPDSLAEFGWALFRRWRDAGSPSKDRWAMEQLGRSGDDETVRRLTPVIRAWPGEGGHKYAVAALGVLAEIGSDVALMHLHGIAEKVKFKGLRAEARKRIDEVAEQLGLSTEQLADRLVPEFGLDADGSLTLDYGPRRFTVTFDEHLKPLVADEGGKPRKALPKPGAKDDPELAPAAAKAFAALRKDVRTVADGQLRRLERAMVTQRRWTPDEFRRFIVGHPLVRHLARRLVWTAGDGATFRIAEDRTLADVHDEAFTLPESARVGIAHPVLMGDSVAAWAEVFADYEILQPFPQLARPVHVLTEEERGSGRLERFEGLKVPFGKVLGLVARGWDRGTPLDAGGERWISRRVAADRYVVIDLDPGIAVGAVDATGDHQRLDYVWLATEPTDFWPSRGTPHRFGELDPVTASEIITDLTTLSDAAVAA
ncbi:DUF4132 domain-containing protein [Actinomadura fibrosa]|uniref:DUF4132 domain-containing protein n=1 Tax=Actinomadura fibrosa TaxID=111802 RepID=A0ABW2XA96_9ACTN|nr:DUF4132 domain-containing protein [Actinomadura fibrosa]